MMDPLQQLGRAVAHEQDALLEERDEELRRVRARLLSAPERQRGWLYGGALVGATVLAALAFVALAPTEAVPLTYRVGDAPRPAPVGQWLSAGQSALPIVFSDGTRLELQTGSDGEVAALGPRGADFHLEQGRVQADVVHRQDTRFLVEAGPFSVHVVGTRFDVAWSPTDARFELHLQQGEVRVSGPLIEERSVVAGEYLVVWARDGRIEVGEDAATAEATAESSTSSTSTIPAQETAETAAAIDGVAEGVATVVDRAPSKRTLVVAAIVDPPSEAPEAEPSFDELARSGQYAEAVRAAQAAGWQDTLDTADAAPLLRLADAARLAGRDELATAAYERVRTRFAGSSRGAQATFALGRLAFDRRGQPAAAARHFAAYLREAPRGVFAREASGRLLEAHRAAGDAAAARVAAQAYLEAYPEGPHAPLAQSLAGP